MSARVLVIGLDGATFAVMDPLGAQGRLPHLHRLRAEGIGVVCHSTFPPSSAPAWTTCRTGVNPGMHGVFDFWRLRGYEWTFASSRDVRAPTVEQILSRRGFRVCTVNVPLTFPPQPVNGVVIAGLPAPSEGEGLLWVGPEDALVEERVATWPVDALPDAKDDPWEEVLDRYLLAHRRRAQIVEDLLARERWDFFMVVFTLSDKIQHTFWRQHAHVVEGKTRGVVPFGGAVEDCYCLLDQTVGALVAGQADGDHVLVVSDHGFGACDYQLYPNVWLRRHGYLRLRWPHKVWARRLTWKRGLPRVSIGPPYRRINWAKTKAFAALYVESHALWLNMRGRQPRGVVRKEEARALLRELTDGLLAVRMPNGRPALAAVAPPEEMVEGPYAQEWGDLILRVDDEGTRILGLFAQDEEVEPLKNPRAATGHHRPEGILIARGPRVSVPARAAPRIADIAPTVLHLLGVPVPPHMEGSPLFGG